ncbi:GAF and ANTAR domain-containing protein [Herbiconiux sp. CPCC 203407]|uniref:GAF and ANTAR domain-containing protein n=1 Tax=Herbiconiux oxytropis TaxID=2970915 RepID=A0AA42BTU1_9MICO|nr:GAF and ANTAR domain-containing protein [Herbiconiux oxytropis]MCS5721032.1 GAF and ANTAR domain-containing protein [Herbiconiux oxytropis]MCS5724684.1 GAF and ANTAR domain-containing protein [Herbiconiux oxytropis]
MVDLADTLVVDYDIVDVLHTLVERCADILDATDAGILLPDPYGDLEVIASTSERSQLISLLQVRADEGPCVDAYESGELVTVESIAATFARWPKFATDAAELDYLSMHAIPMKLRGQTIGSLNLFRDATGPLHPDDAIAARALADVATISILQERTLRQAQIAQEQLQHALNSRVVIEQAKGVLSHSENIDMTEAFNRMRARARTTGARLSDVAEKIISQAQNRQP